MEPYDAKKSQKCKLCGYEFMHNKQGLFTSHLKKEHGLDLHSYLIKYYYTHKDLRCNGINCENLVTLRRGIPNKFCSRNCAQRKCKKRICPVCKEKFYNQDYRIKTCSTSCSKKLKSEKIIKWHAQMSQEEKKSHFTNIITKTAKTRRKNHTPSWNSGKTGVYDEQTIQKIRNATLKQMKNQSFKKTKIERLMETILEELSLEYKCSYILENRQYDFVVPKLKLLIECDGDYWHANPRYYPNPDDWQIERIKIDNYKNEIARRNEFRICRFWEFDILNNRDFVKKELKRIILTCGLQRS